MYCPADVFFFDVHLDSGISQCLVNTIANAFITIYLMVFGIWELRMYRKNGTPQSSDKLPKSKLYSMQMFVTYFSSLLAIVRFFVQLNYFYNGQMCGFMVLTAMAPVINFLFSAYLIKLECHNMLPKTPRRRHSVTLLLFWTFLLIFESMSFKNIRRDDWQFHMKTTPAKVEIVLFITQYISSLLIFVLGLQAPGIVTSHLYDSLNEDSKENSETQKNKAKPFSWSTVWKKFKIMIPFLWPRKNLNLQCRAVICLILVLSGRLLNIALPYYSKLIVDSLTGEKPAFRWDYAVILAAVTFLQGGGTGGAGLLSNIHSILWTTVQQNTNREVKVELFRHLHSLSLRWHLSRETGEVLRLMDRGTDSVSYMLKFLVFDIIPTFLDIFIAIVYFVNFFSLWFGLLVLVTMVFYLVSSVYLTEWRVKYKRSTIQADDDTESRSIDSLLNFETVKYYGAEEYEVNKYNEAILHSNKQHLMSSVLYTVLSSIQTLIIVLAMLGSSLFCMYEIAETKSLSVGDYILFTSYLMELYASLSWFGSAYRYILDTFVDMEKMFDLLAEEPEIKDLPSASTLAITNGEIEFQDVSFSYIPERPILKNISFKVEPGKTVALVGPSGSGKTTIVRLIFRFYDVTSGSISIDGQNVQIVTQKSLRKAIGVVPQDTVLFNSTIKFNIQYGRPDASDSDVTSAAESADIHERILTFPDKYDTVVGERGLKLSGGEKQRVAIARTILKSPYIVLLDEATSSLDTLSERNIQAALNKVCQNRTTVIIAHRLSTVIHADEILVLRDGEICERGRHQELVDSGGLYATMWQQQLENNQSSDTTQETTEKL